MIEDVATKMQVVNFYEREPCEYTHELDSLYFTTVAVSKTITYF